METWLRLKITSHSLLDPVEHLRKKKKILLEYSLKELFTSLMKENKKTNDLKIQRGFLKGGHL